MFLAAEECRWKTKNFGVTAYNLKSLKWIVKQTDIFNLEVSRGESGWQSHRWEL